MREIPFELHHSPSVDPFADDPDNSPQGFELAAEIQRRIWAWVWQPPAADLDGIFCRSIVCCWVFVPQLRDYSETEMAGRVGKKKQSLGRWVVEFKKEFPDLCKHLKHLR